MSRIGRKTIKIPEKVNVNIQDDKVIVVGPLGQLSVDILPGIEVVVEDGHIKVMAKNQERQTKAYHGLIRSLINNCVIGVTKGYKKVLKLVGTGYRVMQKDGKMIVTVGFSHPVEIKPVEGVKITNQGKDTIIVEGIDKQLVGQVAANIRAIKPPEPYKGKGIRYENEVVRRKAGKVAAG